MMRFLRFLLFMSCSLLLGISLFAQNNKRPELREFTVISWPGKTMIEIKRINEKIGPEKELSKVLAILAKEQQFFTSRVVIAIAKERQIRYYTPPVDTKKEMESDSVYTKAKGTFFTNIYSAWRLKAFFSRPILILDSLNLHIDLRGDGISDEHYRMQFQCKKNDAPYEVPLIAKDQVLKITSTNFLRFCTDGPYRIKLYNDQAGPILLGDCDIILGDQELKETLLRLHQLLRDLGTLTESEIWEEITNFTDRFYGNANSRQLKDWLQP